LLLIDGPAGAGKTTLASHLMRELGGEPSEGAGTYDPAHPTAPDAPVQIIHGDDLYEGWSGLATLDAVLVNQVLEPLSRCVEGAFRMWDWNAARRTHLITVPPRELLIVEGVGVASKATRTFASLVIFVDAPWPVRLERGMERDGESMRHEWERWHLAEDAYLREQGTRSEADVVVDGTRLS
jgi:uridine kinase